MFPSGIRNLAAVITCLLLIVPAGWAIEDRSVQSRPNAVSIDLAPPVIGIAAGGIGFGTSYERAVFGYLSLRTGGGIIYVPFAEYDLSGNYLAGSLFAGVRGYPLGRAPRGPYLGVHGGYLGFSVRGSESGVSSSMSLHLPFISADAGWKFVFGRRRVGFFLEPYITFMYVFEGVTLAAVGNISSVSRSGSNIGLLILGVNLGLVF
jgi:hypothetical protein